nr:MAG TPA: zinc finger domain protein [Caudoviricetes sp.]
MLYCLRCIRNITVTRIFNCPLFLQHHCITK